MKTHFGNTGKILLIDLTNNTTQIDCLPLEYARDYIGGAILASKLLFDSNSFLYDAYSPNNPIIFSAGPLTGTSFPGSSRFEVISKSPLSEGFGSASCGGDWGYNLKKAGFDCLVVKGTSQNPVYIYINDEDVKILPANNLWGMDTYEFDDIVKQIHQDKTLKTLSIGQAGENLVKFACIISGKQDSAGRCGMGAVMGSKKLKGIVLKGKGKIPLANEENFSKIVKKLNKKINEDMTALVYRAYGTDSAMQMSMAVSDVPTKNWRVAKWFQGADKLNGVLMAETILKKTKGCITCPIKCKRVVEFEDEDYSLPENPGPEYETCASLGTLLLNDNLKAVAYMNSLCNKYGMDTISLGSSIAFAIEAYENKVLSKSDCDNLNLDWGNVKVVIDLIKKTAFREGIGNLIAEGTKRMTNILGEKTKEFAINCKGVELPMHDPRAYHSLALAYAVSNRGACHIKHLNLPIEMGVTNFPEIGIKGKYDPLSSDRKAEMTVSSENLSLIISSLVLCNFPMWCMTIPELTDSLNFATGLDYNTDTLINSAERGWCIQRSFNNLCGIFKKDDTLPKRVLSPFLEGEPTGLDKIIRIATGSKPPLLFIAKNQKEKIIRKIMKSQGKTLKLIDKILPFGKLKGTQLSLKSKPNLDLMLKEYYHLRSLDDKGICKIEKLTSLRLDFVVEKMKNLLNV